MASSDVDRDEDLVIEQIAEALVPDPSRSVPVLASSFSDRLELDDAYRIQRAVANHRHRAGDRVVGRKVGLVDPEAQSRLGATEPIGGYLFASGQIPAGGMIGSIAREPAAVECELAFIMNRELAGPGVTLDAALDAVAGAVASLEVIESRLPGSALLVDMVADNCSGAGYVVGDDPIAPRSLDRFTTGVVLEGDGHVIASGATGGVLGDPARSLMWLADRLGSLGDGLRSGDIVLTGAIIPPVPTDRAARFRASFGGGLGAVDVGGHG